METRARQRTGGGTLESAAELVTSALDPAPFGFVVARNDGTIVAVNQRVAEWHLPPLPRVSFAGRSVAVADDQVLQGAIAAARAGRSRVVSVECLTLLGDRPGAWRIHVGPFGTPNTDAIALVVEDQSEQTLAAEAFAASERRFRLLVDSANDGIAVHREGVLLYANPAAVRMLGYERAEEIIGRPILEFVHPDYREAVRERISDLAQGHLAPLREEVFLRADGSSVVVEVSASRAPMGAGFANFVFFRDISAHKALQAELERARRMESLGRLAGGIAHDFNNLIGTIQSALELARHSAGESEGVARALAGAESATQRAADLTRQLLTFSRGGAAQASAVDPNTVIRETLSLLELSNAHVELCADLDPDLGKIWIDPSQLHQVVLNLLLNARDAVSDGGRIHIRTGRRWRQTGSSTSPSDWIVIEVDDTGPGMSPETRARIFEPFFTTKKSGGGTGLGLSTVYGVVGQAGGFIDVQSRLGAGTKFEVFLPPIGVSSPPPASVTRCESSDRRRRVLICDDESRLAMLTAGLLDQHGYDADSVGTGPEALERLSGAGARYDALILDVNLVGLAALELLDAMASRGLALPVVLTSGYAEEDVPAELSSRPEVVGYLAKPYPVERLVEAVGKAVAAGDRAELRVRELGQ